MSRALRDEYVTRFEAIPTVRTATSHDEPLTVQEVKRIGSKATPIVHVVCRGLRDVVLQGRRQVGVYEWTAFVLTNTSSRAREGEASRGDQCSLIASMIVAELGSHQWDAATERPTSVRCLNLASSAMAKAGYAMWAVDWRHHAPLDTAVMATALRDLERVHTYYDAAPVDGTADSESEVIFP